MAKIRIGLEDYESEVIVLLIKDGQQWEIHTTMNPAFVLALTNADLTKAVKSS